MVDITKEIQGYKKEGIESVRDDLYRAKDEINKKLHIINVYSALCHIQGFLEGGDFEKANLFHISITNYHDYDKGHVIDFDLLNIHKATVEQLGSRQPSLYSELYAIFKTIKMDKNFIGTALPSEQTAIFRLDSELINNLKNILLSDELKTSLTYALLDTELSEKPSDSRKIKI